VHDEYRNSDAHSMINNNSIELKYNDNNRLLLSVLDLLVGRGYIQVGLIY